MVARWTDSAMADHELGLITARTAFAIGFGYAVTDKLELSARLPMYQQTSEARGMGDPFGLDGADGFALGDVGVRAKAQLVKGKVGFAGALDLTAPTAKDGQFTGTDLPTAHIQGLIGIKPNRRLSLALNAGFMARQSTQFLLVEQGSEVTYGAALAIRVLDKVALVGEGSGALGIVGAEGKVSPIEASVGLRVRASRSATVGFGGGSGFGRGIGVADMRGFVTVTIAPGGSPIEPVKIIVPPPPRDTKDDDGDGVVNADDACRTDAEDGDGFKDEEGCPDADNDDDGLLDGADKCPMEPEDKDNVTDDDGCADRDNDGDGVNDEDDKCPNEAEDKDGFNDNDGCDEPDNDNDGVPDVLDQCALEPETVNGNNDEDGCPDTGELCGSGTGACLCRRAGARPKGNREARSCIEASWAENIRFQRQRARQAAHPPSGGRTCGGGRARDPVSLRVSRAARGPHAFPDRDEPRLEHQPVPLPQSRRRLRTGSGRHAGARARQEKIPELSV
jgi:hypothetical protein